MLSTLITVANRGLGLEFARQYLADGWQVYAACRDPDSASELRGLADDSDDKLQILVLHIPKDEMKSGREDFNAEVPDDVARRLRWSPSHPAAPPTNLKHRRSVGANPGFCSEKTYRRSITGWRYVLDGCGGRI